MEDKKIRIGYLYSLWSGKFNVYKGEIGPSFNDGTGAFKTDFGKRFLCSSEPGIIYNAVVWLDEDNEALGRQILIDYQKQQIAKLQEKIDNHLYKIKVLRSGL